MLLHDESHGAPLIDALARFGEGLPAHVLPFAVNEITQIGLESIVAAFAYGASAMRFLLRARPRHDASGLLRTMTLADPILTGLGFGSGRIDTIETDDPDFYWRHFARSRRCHHAASGELPSPTARNEAYCVSR